MVCNCVLSITISVGESFWGSVYRILSALELTLGNVNGYSLKTTLFVCVYSLCGLWSL